MTAMLLFLVVLRLFPSWLTDLRPPSLMLSIMNEVKIHHRLGWSGSISDFLVSKKRLWCSLTAQNVHLNWMALVPFAFVSTTRFIFLNLNLNSSMLIGRYLVGLGRHFSLHNINSNIPVGQILGYMAKWRNSNRFIWLSHRCFGFRQPLTELCILQSYPQHHFRLLGGKQRSSKGFKTVVFSKRL